MKPGDLVVIVGKMDNKIREKDSTKLVVGTYMGTLNIEGMECYVMTENGDIWTGLHRDIVKYSEQK